MFRVPLKTALGTTLLALSLSAPAASFAEQQLHEVKIYKFKFIPAEITIDAGDNVRWTNDEKRQYHSVWFEALGEPEPDYIFPDETYERVFEEPGDYPYRCGPHPEMRGMVHVK